MTTGLSVCIITLNEVHNLGACLDSVAFAEEVVVLDSGSTDGTVELARSRGARVEVEAFRGFGPQKNRCFELAGHDWLLSLDADERVCAALAEEVQRALAAPGVHAAFDFPRENFVAGRAMRRGGPFHNWPDRVVRLLRRGRARCKERAVHEEMLVDGLIGHLQAPLRHDAYPTYDAMLRTMDRYATLGALRAFDEGQAQSFRASTTHALLRGAATFFQKFVLRGGFLDGAHGFLGSAAAAGYAFLKYAKLAELGERARAGEDLAAERSRLLRPPAP